MEAAAGYYNRILAEFRAGRKTTHWMWFHIPSNRWMGYPCSSPRLNRTPLQPRIGCSNSLRRRRFIPQRAARPDGVAATPPILYKGLCVQKRGKDLLVQGHVSKISVERR